MSASTRFARTVRLVAPVLAVGVLAACQANKGSAGADGGSAAAETSGPAFHCLKKSISRCEQATESQLAAAKTKLEAGTTDEKKMAGFMTKDGFKAFCDKGEYGDGACATANVVGACVSDAGKTFYYGGAEGYTAALFAYECSSSQSPESADGKPMPKPAPLKVSCERSKKSTCIESNYTGKLGKMPCADNDYDGPGKQEMAACPTEKRVASCTDKPMEYQGKTIGSPNVTYAYSRAAAGNLKQLCTIMQGTYAAL